MYSVQDILNKLFLEIEALRPKGDSIEAAVEYYSELAAQWHRLATCLAAESMVADELLFLHRQAMVQAGCHRKGC